jgi:hypothetical protein
MSGGSAAETAHPKPAGWKVLLERNSYTRLTPRDVGTRRTHPDCEDVSDADGEALA